MASVSDDWPPQPDGQSGSAQRPVSLDGQALVLSRTQYAEAQREWQSRRKRIKEVRRVLRTNEHRNSALVRETIDQHGLVRGAGVVR